MTGVQTCALPICSGTFPSKFTIASIPNSVVVARASKLGVSLGKSPCQVSESVDLIKKLDLNHSLTILSRDTKNSVIHTEGDLGSLVLQEALDLSDDLLGDESMDKNDHKDHNIRPPRTTRVSKKSAKEISVVRRSARLKKK